MALQLQPAPRRLQDMTLAHHAPAIDAPDFESALTALRAHGLRISASRRAVLEALYADRRPQTADELARDGDLASVYRNLDTLEELGLVRHVHLGHGPGLYSLDDYEFVTCEACGRYEAIAPGRLAPIKDEIERELGYRPRFTHFPIVGLCASCQQEHGHAHP
jgi:Fur family ferric uptake transcriptional regulator